MPEGVAQPGQPISAHPNSGPAAGVSAELPQTMPVVEYDAEGNFKGVIFPSPEAVAEAAFTDAESESRPWAKG